MRKFTSEKLRKIIDLHEKWLRNQTDGVRANLREADLCGADLRQADLRQADLRWATLYEADLRGAKGVPFIPMACPDSGEFIGWKKASDYIVKLKILEDSKRSSATGRKCRCNKALVFDIQSIDGNGKTVDEITSDYDSSFVYKIGGTVSVDNFDDDRWNECAHGIHFFVNRQEAVNYSYL